MTATASIINNTDLDWNQTTTIVIAALRAGEVEHITESAIAKQCNVKLRNVPMLLEDACTDGPLTRVRNADGELGYSLRSTKNAPAPASAPAPAPKPAAMTASLPASLGQLLRDRIDDAGDTVPVYTRPTPATEAPAPAPDRKQVTLITKAAKASTPAPLKIGERLPEIDVASIGVVYDITCPPRSRVKRGSYWDPLFARLDRVGAASDVIAIEYRGSCSKAKDHWHKTHPKHRIEVRKSADGHGFRLFRVA